jgi:DNA-directed RNA polymerase subunit M/transcription elongation factor TFIIS
MTDIIDNDNTELINDDAIITNTNNKHPVRDEVKKVFSNIGLSEIEVADLEIGIFNRTIDYANSLHISLSWSSHIFMETYINYARGIYSNLNKDSYIKNDKLIERFHNREFLPHELPYMSCEDLYPERWSKIIERQKLKFKAAYEIKQVAMTDSIKCSRCKNNKISYYELQTRSGDEAMTCYFNCIICGHKWKN